MRFLSGDRYSLSTPERLKKNRGFQFRRKAFERGGEFQVSTDTTTLADSSTYQRRAEGSPDVRRGTEGATWCVCPARPAARKNGFKKALSASALKYRFLLDHGHIHADGCETLSLWLSGKCNSVILQSSTNERRLAISCSQFGGPRADPDLQSGIRQRQFLPRFRPPSPVGGKWSRPLEARSAPTVATNSPRSIGSARDASAPPSSPSRLESFGSTNVKRRRAGLECDWSRDRL